MENTYKHIPAEKFEFVQLGKDIHDEKLQTKPRSFMKDALIRFSKNKSSVIAAGIIAFLVLFAIIAPMLSPYTMDDKDKRYEKMPPYIEWFANNNIGILDGSFVYESQNTKQMDKLLAMEQETGTKIVLEYGEHSRNQIIEGKPSVVKTYTNVKVNYYIAKGFEVMTFSEQEFNNIMKWQDENDIQVIYPWVVAGDTGAAVNVTESVDYNFWYKVDKNGNAIKENGEFVNAYATTENYPRLAGDIIYDSKRVEGDDGTFIYGEQTSGSIKARVFYYNYYQYLYEHKPTYILGTDNMGRDLSLAIGMGARFSLIFAIIVSAINLTIGAFYGAVQGYYGGILDITLDRISDILSGVPSIVVVTLFQLHLAQKVGPIVSFLFAFVATGWIGMAALTRKQFYRFKGQEYIMAARTLGASDGRLMFKHIFPNAIGTMITSCAMVIPGVISSETSLTYLGIVNLNDFVGTSIGSLMAAGRNGISTAPHAMLYPALFLSLLLISFNLFGNGLRDAFNPSTRGADE